MGSRNTREVEKKEEEGAQKKGKERNNKEDYCWWVKTDLDVIPPAQIHLTELRTGLMYPILHILFWNTYFLCLLAVYINIRATGYQHECNKKKQKKHAESNMFLNKISGYKAGQKWA